MNYVLLRDEWYGPKDELFIAFDVYDEVIGELVWQTDYYDVEEFDASLLDELRSRIAEQCETFKLTADLTSDSPTDWAEEWEERTVRED